MAKRKRGRLRSYTRRTMVCAQALVTAICSLWQAFCCRRPSIPVEVLTQDRARRLALQRALRAALRQLERALGGPPPTRLAVVVQESIRADSDLLGCCQVWQRPDGSRFALIRLVLQVEGRSLGIDELLSALGEQYVGLAVRLCERPAVLFPLESTAPQFPQPSRPLGLRPDPLAPNALYPRGSAGEPAA